MDIRNEIDEITEQSLQPDLSFKVNRVKHWFISNVFGRALSYLVGWTGDKAVMLRCTSNGTLKTADSGSGFETNGTWTGTSTNSYANVFSGTTLYSRLDIWIAANEVTIKRSNDTLSWDTEFTLEAGNFYSFDCITAQLAIKSTVAGSHGTYKIIGWR